MGFVVREHRVVDGTSGGNSIMHHENQVGTRGQTHVGHNAVSVDSREVSITILEERWPISTIVWNSRNAEEVLSRLTEKRKHRVHMDAQIL
jgi:hypothetical protein